MINVEKLDLHDAVLMRLDVDYGSGIVKIDMDYYESSESSSRKPVTLIFEGVDSFSHICDFDRLKKNAGAGNVSYWVPAHAGVTYIYLADGVIAINHKKNSVLPRGDRCS